MRPYTVEYTEYKNGEVLSKVVLANNKYEAYDKVAYEVCDKEIGCIPYSCWVAGVTYNNGNYKRFNTFEGNPY